MHEAFKHALKKKLDSYSGHDGEEEDGLMSHHDGDAMHPLHSMQAEENDGHMIDDAESQKDTDLAPDLQGEGMGHDDGDHDGNDVADDDKSDMIHQKGQLSPEEHHKVLSAIADSHLGGKGREPSSLHERAASGAKAAIAKHAAMKKK